MLKTEPRNLLVCVSPGEDCGAALEYAVAQARGRGCGVHLVTVLPPLFGERAGGGDLRLVDGTLRHFGRDFLDSCEAKILELGDGAVSVSTRLRHGSAVAGLVAESENAALVVTQHHRMHHKHHLPAFSVTNGVAARAHAPVVALPDDWRETEPHPDVVAVGVEDAVTSSAVVRTAFGEARRLGAELRLIRAWFFSAAFDGDVFAGAAGRAQTAEVAAEVERDFAAIASEFPEVEWRAVAVHGRAPDALVAASEAVRLLVVGRHDPVAPLGSHLGPVTRPVLTHAACPVLVVDPRP